MERLLLWIVLGLSAATYADIGDVVVGPMPIRWESPLGVRVSPSSPTRASGVVVTVCGWKLGGSYMVYDTDVRLEGADIWIDLYWKTLGSGLSTSTQYEHTVPLGMLDPGTYTVHAANHDALGGSGTATFTVSGAANGPDPLDLLDRFEWPADPPTPSINLPGFEIEHVAISDVGGAKDGISDLSIQPAHPKSSDEISVTISGWKPNPDLDVERTTLRTEGNVIWLDLYWYIRPPVPVAHETGGGGGINLMQGQCWATSVTVIQLDVTPYSGVPFTYTQSLGTLSAGTYTLHVINHSPMTGSASTMFTVMPSTGAGGQPSWWQSLLQGTP